MVDINRSIAFAVLLATMLLPGMAHADTQCLAPAQVRSAVSDAKALRLAVIKPKVERAMRGEIVHARLCRMDENLVYALTVLRAGGQVERVLANALSGTILEGAWPAGFSGALPASIKSRPIAK